MLQLAKVIIKKGKKSVVLYFTIKQIQANKNITKL